MTTSVWEVAAHPRPFRLVGRRLGFYFIILSLTCIAKKKTEKGQEHVRHDIAFEIWDTYCVTCVRRQTGRVREEANRPETEGMQHIRRGRQGGREGGRAWSLSFSGPVISLFFLFFFFFPLSRRRRLAAYHRGKGQSSASQWLRKRGMWLLVDNQRKRKKRDKTVRFDLAHHFFSFWQAVRPKHTGASRIDFVRSPA